MTNCARCVMPETVPHIILDNEGVCNICKKQEEFENNTVNTKKIYDIDLLMSKLEKYKGKDGNAYDCIVSVSGGKDSIMTLYVAKKILKLNPLAVFIDNGFACPEMYENIFNATDILGIDLNIFRTSVPKNVFKYLLLKKQPIYYCRLCHALIDQAIRDIALKFDLKLILGGYTKGQNYLKNSELYWIYNISDTNTKNLLSEVPGCENIIKMFQNLAAYFKDNYGSITQISPFWYLEYNEDEIMSLITEKLKFKKPKQSWPMNSSNCTFNYVSQYLARQNFGYSQHEVEMSYLARCKEITRKRALEIINTPITEEDLSGVLQKFDLELKDII